MSQQGNWLRDYSQAIDIAGLSRMTEETLLIIIQALGFMTFGFATREFLVTPERLGCYLPVVRIRLHNFRASSNWRVH